MYFPFYFIRHQDDRFKIVYNDLLLVFMIVQTQASLLFVDFSKRNASCKLNKTLNGYNE